MWVRRQGPCLRDPDAHSLRGKQARLAGGKWELKKEAHALNTIEQAERRKREQARGRSLFNVHSSYV